MNHTSTCCRTPEGVTVGLIDGIIAGARVIREREAQAAHDGEYSEAVDHALKDLQQDDDMAWLMNWDQEGGVNALRKVISEKDEELALLYGTVKALTDKEENAQAVALPPQAPNQTNG